VKGVGRTQRRGLLLIALATFLGVALELVLTEHYKEPAQLIPIVLCVLGAAATAAGWRWPNPSIIALGRALIGLLAIGALFGMREHWEFNAGFAAETTPSGDQAAILRKTLGGAAPLLAPNVLILAGASLALATLREGEAA
jgi:hypothetical protein